MIKWFKKSMKKYEDKQNNKVVKSYEKYKAIPANKEFKRMNAIASVFVDIGLCKGYDKYKADYIGGYSLMEDTKKGVEFTVLENNLVFNYIDGREIPLNKIVSVELKTEQEIKHSVTLTRLLAVGLLALAIPKKKAHTLHYLVINLGNESIVLAGENLGKAYSMLYKLINDKEL